MARKKSKKTLVPHTVIYLPHAALRMAQGLCSPIPRKLKSKAPVFQDFAVRSFDALLASLCVCPRLLPSLSIHTVLCSPTANSHLQTCIPHFVSSMVPFSSSSPLTKQQSLLMMQFQPCSCISVAFRASQALLFFLPFDCQQPSLS